MLVELDEKQDAVRYMFEYIERQIEQKRKKEVLNALNYLEGLEVKDEGIENRISEYYKKIGVGKARKRSGVATVQEQQEIADRRKTMRADSVIPVLEKSLGILSAEQREAISNMQRSVGNDLDKIHKSLPALVT
ncbi:hypothetical protein IBX73_04285 [candidate division WOR-3 bacterium]|nr:hypothetical protein [candidate division WOR-3 bacterium]